MMFGFGRHKQKQPDRQFAPQFVHVKPLPPEPSVKYMEQWKESPAPLGASSSVNRAATTPPSGEETLKDTTGPTNSILLLGNPWEARGTLLVPLPLSRTTVHNSSIPRGEALPGPVPVVERVIEARVLLRTTVPEEKITKLFDRFAAEVKLLYPQCEVLFIDASPAP